MNERLHVTKNDWENVWKLNERITEGENERKDSRNNQGIKEMTNQDH